MIKLKSKLSKKHGSNSNLDSQIDFGRNSDENIVSSMVKRFGMLLASPEETVILQGDESIDMYYIIQGDCTVNITEHDQKEHVAVKLLSPGRYFGEIGLIYSCVRTASIIKSRVPSGPPVHSVML